MPDIEPSARARELVRDGYDQIADAYLAAMVQRLKQIAGADVINATSEAEECERDEKGVRNNEVEAIRPKTQVLAEIAGEQCAWYRAWTSEKHD